MQLRNICFVITFISPVMQLGEKKKIKKKREQTYFQANYQV